MSVIQVNNTTEFENYINITNKKYILVDFQAKWCKPCQKIAPRIEALSNKYPQILFLKVDINQIEELADRYNVSSIPAFFLFKKGNPIPLYKPIIGADEKKIESIIQLEMGTFLTADF